MFWLLFITLINNLIKGAEMTLRNLASLICKKEGKKSQARIGDVREIISIYYDICSSKEYGMEMCDLNNKEMSKRDKKLRALQREKK